MTHTRNLNSAISRLSQKVNAISINYQKSQMIDSRHSRVLAQIPVSQQSRMSDANMEVAVATELNGLLYMKGSVHRVSQKDPSLMSFFVYNPQKTVDMEQASANGLTQVSDTVFQDANDDVWSVIAQGDHAFLIKAQEEDISGLLAAVKMRAIATASLNTNLHEDFSAGMPVMFYDIDRCEKAFGVAIDGARVYVETATDEKEIKVVDPIQVIGVVDDIMLPVDTEKAASDGKISKAELIEYMAMLYGNNSEMLNEIKRAINEMY